MFRSNSKSFSASLRRCALEERAKVAKRIVLTAHWVHESLVDKTPVWEGKTVRNYIMTVGSPFSGEYEAIGTGPTGQTSKMALGTEPRRGPNAEAALSTGRVLSEKNAFNRIYVTNNSDTVAGLEAGILPGGGLPSRSPQGMFAITLQEAASRLKSKRL